MKVSIKFCKFLKENKEKIKEFTMKEDLEHSEFYLLKLLVMRDKLESASEVDCEILQHVVAL